MARPFLAAVGLVFVAHSYAWAQNPVQIAAKSDLPEQWKKFEGSSLGSVLVHRLGLFLHSGYSSNSYASLAVFALPSYDLGTRYKLALRARIILEEELTAPDNADRPALLRPTIPGSGWRPTTCTRSSGRRSGSAAASAPSGRCRTRADIGTMWSLWAVGPNVNRTFEFGAGQ